MFTFPLLNPWNIKSSYKLFTVLTNPLKFLKYLIFSSGHPMIGVRTPIGNLNILMRNRQSARTLYSIFIREDYYIDKNNKNILDLGSNIGISALYFLSRNHNNKILCIEADPNNDYYLKKNLENFQDRSQIYFCAVGNADLKSIPFNLSIDGKYSSIKDIGKKLKNTIKVNVISINNALKKGNFSNSYPILMKIDVEGLEEELIKNFDFKNNLRINELIAEGTGYKRFINRKGKLEVINGYVEKYSFQDF